MDTSKVSSDAGQPSGVSRRGFIAGAAAAATVAVVRPTAVRGTEANSKIAIGMIGCGNRGTWIANLFMKHGGYALVGGADYFADKVTAFGDKFQIAASARFTGLAGYRRLLEQKLDAVVIESPPYFHVEQAAAGVAAGKHVYCAKPIAVDVPGCLTMAEVGKQGTAAKRCVLVDFQTRTDACYQETVRRVRAGDIGPIVSAEAVYYCGTTWTNAADALAADPKNPENRLRAWGIDHVLSGDVITEQNIHALDVASWFLDANPLKAYGLCGPRGRTDQGTCHDNFAATFTFPGDVPVAFASKQYGTGYDDIGCRVFGPDGSADTHYFGLVMIRGKKSYKGGNMKNLYTEGANSNIAAFHNNITKGDFTNPTVEPSVRSNLTTILGRMACYQRREVTWDEMLKKAEKFDFPTQGLKS